jgi:hypothetical protein
MARLSQLLISQILKGVSLGDLHACTPTGSARHYLFSRSIFPANRDPVTCRRWQYSQGPKRLGPWSSHVCMARFHVQAFLSNSCGFLASSTSHQSMIIPSQGTLYFDIYSTSSLINDSLQGIHRGMSSQANHKPNARLTLLKSP